MSVTQNF